MVKLNLPDPYPFQTASLNGVRQAIKSLKDSDTKGTLLSMATGSGKTEVAKQMVASAMLKGSRALFMVDRQELLEQTSRRFWESGIDHGLIGGGMDWGHDRKVLVGMKQAIAKRGFPPGLSVVFDDECHIMYRAIIDGLPKLGIPYVGLSATPFTRGLGKIYPKLVQNVTTEQLINDGFLSPTVIRPAVEIDMSGAPLSNGEWADKTVQDRGRVIIGDIVSTWVEETNKHFGGPVKTMLFSASIAHGEELCGEFQAAGIDFRQVSAHDEPAERKELMRGFRHGEFPGIASVDVLSRGVDIPDVMCIIIARPFRKAFAAHIQMLGRIMRKAPGKPYGLVLDHSGNCLGWYHETAEFFANGITELDDRSLTNKTRSEEREIRQAKCSGCGMVLPPGIKICPACGTERRRINDIQNVPGKMISIDPISKGKRGWTGDEAALWQACCTHAAKFLTRHGDEKRAMRHAKATYHELASRWPPDHYRFIPGGSVPVAIKRKIDQNYRRWKKQQGPSA